MASPTFQRIKTHAQRINYRHHGQDGSYLAEFLLDKGYMHLWHGAPHQHL